MMRSASGRIPVSLTLPARVRGWFAVVAVLVFAAVSSAAPTNENEVIIPNSNLKKTAPVSAAPPGSGTFTAVGVLILAGAGGWLLWRGRGGNMAKFNRTARQLVIEESRSLGSRQFLVVATYQDKKFLLSVCPGRIDFLAPLNDSTPNPEKARS